MNKTEGSDYKWGSKYDLRLNLMGRIRLEIEGKTFQV
jgi:hypothetical protein